MAEKPQKTAKNRAKKDWFTLYFFDLEEFQKPGEYYAKTGGFRPKRQGWNLCYSNTIANTFLNSQSIDQLIY